MPCYIHVRVEPGAQIFCRVYGNYINVANPNSANRHFSCLLVPITRNSVLSSFNINLSLVIHERTSAMHFSIASSALVSFAAVIRVVTRHATLLPTKWGRRLLAPQLHTYSLVGEMTSIIEYHLRTSVQTAGEI